MRSLVVAPNHSTPHSPNHYSDTLQGSKESTILRHDRASVQADVLKPAEEALNYYTQLQDAYELETQVDDDAMSPHHHHHVQSNSQQQQQQQVLGSTAAMAGAGVGKQQTVDRMSSIDAMGFGVEYKFRVQKIVARPAK